MKVATGEYINIFSEAGYQNCGLSNRYDIFICLTESFGELSKDIVDAVEMLVDKKLIEIGKIDPNASKETVYMAVRDVLDALNYEYAKITVERE